MSFTQNLVLWLHLLFAVFTIGPVTIAISSTPRYIRQHDVRIVRYLSRTTFIFALGSLGVLIAGEALASMERVKGSSLAGKPWVIISATLFIVALALLALIIRDQRRAIKALEEAAAVPTPAAPTAPAEAPAPAPAITAGSADAVPADSEADSSADATPAPEAPAAAAAPAGADAEHVANVEQSRIAMMGGLVGLIWLVILVLMVWQ
jgi:hypothetical protein